MRRAAFDEQADPSPADLLPKVRAVRRDYRCAADGCPNAGAIDDRGVEHKGRCFWHWSAPRDQWDQITLRIRHNPAMGNHGKVPTEPSRHAQEVQAEMRGQPAGLQTMATEGAL